MMKKEATFKEKKCSAVAVKTMIVFHTSSKPLNKTSASENLLHTRREANNPVKD